MEITKAQASFILEAITQKPVNVTFGQVIGGIKLDAEVSDLINKLNEIVNEKPQDNSEAKVEAPAEVQS